jgi:hypothetical protein
VHTPDPCGPLSRLVVSRLRAGPGPTVTSRGVARLRRLVHRASDPLHDRDLQLALACCYELHYGGFDDVADDLEWDPTTLALTGLLERALEAALRAAVTHEGHERVEPAEVPVRLRRLVDSDAEADAGPSLSAFLLRDAEDRHFRDFLAQRSVYHLKEADPHTWVIPRLRGRAKAALVEIQADEYGGGRPAGMHSSLFAATMRALGLDDSYGAYWADATAETFASVNVMTLFGLHRRLRGAALGHLAALEMTSTMPNRRYGNGLRRLGHDVTATAYFDEHVEADAVHEQVASVDLCGSFARAEPALARDVLWGAACCLTVDRLAGTALLSAWSRGTTADPVGEVA